MGHQSHSPNLRQDCQNHNSFQRANALPQTRQYKAYRHSTSSLKDLWANYPKAPSRRPESLSPPTAPPLKKLLTKPLDPWQYKRCLWFIHGAKQLAKPDINAKIKVAKRQQKALIFLEFNRAFDTVNRQLLINKLVQRNLQPDLNRIIANLLTDTFHHHETNSDTYRTIIGVP